ncbi:MAG: PBP1A family penicillin-binding protein [candidate division KSB1 bacterium]|nr:PBP1A family penicillin-binding protein [candidate division KSB1 bacterium]MDZ7301480.1 PBP1A family penicillin-binding protein [candidate division KSB1 bacterium]MDZ7310882.1 PBP1A family penicillin-binding protein [candidate division KSB1 bacterium]
MNFSSVTLRSKTTWIIFGVLVAAIFIPGFFYIYYLSRDLPSLTQLEEYRPKLVSKVYSADGKVIKEFFEERRSFVPLEKMPQHLKDALLATEDQRFYSHWGVNTVRLMQAVAIDLIHMEKRQGASTVTQQLARLLYLTPDKTVARKVREMLTAIQIERTYTKDEILEMYLNQVYLGHGAHGVQMAAQKYFGKDVENLQPHESATLVALVQRPELLSPLRNPGGCLARRNLVLTNMYRNGKLSKQDYLSYKTMPLGVIDRPANEHYGVAPYFTEYVRQLLWQRYGEDLLTRGLKIYTTLDTRAQSLAEKFVARQLQEMQRRVNKRVVAEREHLKIFDQATLDTLGMTLRQVMADSALFNGMLSKRRPVQAALVTIEPATGYIRAMVGGRDFEENKFNRAVQAQRQPGSAFKPFVYTTVIDNGYPPNYEVINQPVVVKLFDGTEWRPHNYDNTIGGIVTLREALARSLNLPTVRLLQEVTKPAVVVEYAHRMGLTTNIPPYDAIALGAGEVIPLEITSAFSAFANQGVRMEPIAILRVEDKDGNVLEDNRPNGKEVLSKETAYIMTDMLRSVIDYGRGTAAGMRSRYQFYRPVAGKTGTTNDFRDAWFIGFTPQLATGVWVGFDRQDMAFEKGETGATVALPIWGPYMKAVHDTLGLPVEDFPVPPGIVRVEICATTKRLANEECPSVYSEVFKAGSEPTTHCGLHRGRERNLRRQR